MHDIDAQLSVFAADFGRQMKLHNYSGILVLYADIYADWVVEGFVTLIAVQDTVLSLMVYS